jgi:hypothetical protein
LLQDEKKRQKVGMVEKYFLGELKIAAQKCGLRMMF